MGKFTQKGIDSMEKKKVKIRVNSTRPESETVGQWMDLWLENYVRPSIRQSTYEVYRAYLDNHLIPKLGEVPLDELSASDIQFFLRDLQYHGNKKSPEKGLSSSTIICIRNLLKSSLEQAVYEERIPRNPARQTKPPKSDTKEMNVLTQDEVTRFLQNSTENSCYAAYVLTLTTGVRRGEVLGLPWRSVFIGLPWHELDKRLPWQNVVKLPLWDTEALKRMLKRRHIQLRHDPFIMITQQLSDLRSGPELMPPKTKRSQRVIGIPIDTALILIFQRCYQQKEKARIGGPYNRDQLVFCDSKGLPLHPRAFTRQFQKALKNSGIRKIRFHDLRHTVATMLLEDGKAINTVQEILGHYNAAFTAAQYGHVTSRMQQEATETLGQVLRKARSSAEL